MLKNKQKITLKEQKMTIEEQIKLLPEYEEKNKEMGCEPINIFPCADGGVRWKGNVLQQLYFVELIYKCGSMENSKRFDAWLDVPQAEE